MTKPQTPLGVSLAAFWEMLMGILGLLFVAAFFLLGTSASLGQLIVGGFTAVWLISAISILTEKSWAWKLGMISSTLSLIGSLTLWLIAFIFLEFFGPGVFLWPLVIYSLSRPNVKKFLSKTAGTV